MILELKRLLYVVGEKKSFECSIPLEELGRLHGVGTFLTPVKAEGTVENRTGVCELAYSVTFTMGLECDRCLKEFEREYKFDFRHILVKSLNSEDENDEYVVCEDNTLDLNELAISDLLLQLPTKVLCRDDCNGLCQKCGTDLNVSECTCDGKQS